MFERNRRKDREIINEGSNRNVSKSKQSFFNMLNRLIIERNKKGRYSWKNLENLLVRFGYENIGRYDKVVLLTKRVNTIERDKEVLYNQIIKNEN